MENLITDKKQQFLLEYQNLCKKYNYYIAGYHIFLSKVVDAPELLEHFEQLNINQSINSTFW